MFGRWKYIAPREYFRRGDTQYRHLSDMVVNSADLTDQLRLEDKNAMYKIRRANLHGA